MKARNLLWISVVNIFLVLLVSVLMEYSDLSGRLRQLENTVSTSLETAIRTSTASEEMFSEKYKNIETSSKGTGTRTSGTFIAPSTLKVLSKNGDSWVEGKTYVMAKYFEEHGGKFPDTQGDYTTFESGFSTDADVYKWLFGKVGSDYYKYDWANRYKSKLWFTDGDKLNYENKLDIATGSDSRTDRTPSDKFKKFYDEIGHKMVSKTYVKHKSGDTFEVVEREIPTLTQMGLVLDGELNDGTEYTSDTLSSVTHFGKSANGLVDTTYYLTPYSLGVTYVPVEVLKPAFLSHLEQFVRFSKVKHTVDASGDLSDFASATGCIPTEVYEGGGSTSEEHHNAYATNKIINDGEIEYDLSTAKVKVDYFFVNFYDNNNWNIVNRIEGSTSQFNAAGNADHTMNTLTSLPERLRRRDTSLNDSSPAEDVNRAGNRIVAKVSVKVKIHIPYKSSILQWFRHLNHTINDNHYDIRLYNNVSDSVEFDADGIWFGYSTYTAVSR